MHSTTKFKGLRKESHFFWKFCSTLYVCRRRPFFGNFAFVNSCSQVTGSASHSSGHCLSRCRFRYHDPSKSLLIRVLVQRCNCFNRDVWKCRSLFKESFRGAVHHVCLSHCLLSFDQGFRFHEVQPGDSHQKPKHTLWSKPRLLRLFGSSIPGASQEHRKSASFRSYRPICLGHREAVSIVRPNLLDDAATWLTFHARVSLRFHKWFTITTKQVEQKCTLNYQRSQNNWFL